MFLLEIFQYDFMTRAILVGIFTAISTAILGNFIVASRQAIVSDMLAHTSLVGVGLGVLFHLSPSFLALCTTVIVGILLWWLSRKKGQAPEAVSMLLLTGGLATALILVHMTKNNPIALDTYLFGSILTITKTEMISFISLNILIIMGLTFFWKPFMILAFDRDFLKTHPYNIFYELGFMLLIALIVGIGLKIIGGLLIGALLVIPVLISQHFTQSFKHNVWLSIVANIFSVVLGISSSFYLDIPASSGIVLSLVLLFLVSKVIPFKKNFYIRK